MLERATIDEVTRRIDEAARRAPGGAIAFDGDGTLWSGDIGEEFFAAVLESGRLSEVAREPLAREAAEHGLSSAGAAEELARRIHAAYLGGAFPEERVCEIMTWVTAGWTVAELDAFAAELASSIGLEGRLHGEAVAIVRWAESRGLPVHLVSASPRAVVERAARVVGIDPSRVSASREAVEAERVCAAVVRPIPYGPGKVTRLRERLGARPLYAAFGDNVFDVAMLRASSVPVAVRPKARLVERAFEVPGLVRLEMPTNQALYRRRQTLHHENRVSGRAKRRQRGADRRRASDAARWSTSARTTGAGKGPGGVSATTGAGGAR